MENQPATSKGKTIKSIYFYLVSFVALMMVVWSGADMINIALKTWVFTQADNYYYDGRIVCETLPTPVADPKATAPVLSREQVIADCEKQNAASVVQQEKNHIAQRQMSIVRDISMIVVAVPLFFIHWRIVRSKEENL